MRAVGLKTLKNKLSEYVRLAAGVTLEGAAHLESAPRVRAVDPRARAWARSVAWRGCPSAPRPDRAARADDSGARTGSRAVPGPCPATGRAAPRLGRLPPPAGTERAPRDVRRAHDRSGAAPRHPGLRDMNRKATKRSVRPGHAARAM